MDTDIGGDPDDAIALAVASGLPELALVITSDEHDGRRARLARHLLDLLGREDVHVVAGKDLGNDAYWAADGLIPEDIAAQHGDVVAAVRDVLEQAGGGLVRWLSIGPMSNLATVITEIPDATKRLIVTQMGGELNYRHADRAEHNIRLDIPAARTVLGTGMRIWIMPADITFHPENEITSSSIEYEMIAGAGGPWELIRAHLDQWFANFHPGTMQHDALALALAMGMAFLRFSRKGVGFDEIGRMTAGDNPVFLTHSADYSLFRNWLCKWLDQVIASSAT
ncbi:nucleoside hydrolase [Nocardia sp. NPDC127526]|uniref:nucleoside hydrolase n=1 Tax=Nocardia sp. NPDC127526 TaxID=3345393 RepID=UPI0036316C6F